MPSVRQAASRMSFLPTVGRPATVLPAMPGSHTQQHDASRSEDQQCHSESRIWLERQALCTDNTGSRCLQGVLDILTSEACPATSELFQHVDQESSSPVTVVTLHSVFELPFTAANRWKQQLDVNLVSSTRHARSILGEMIRSSRSIPGFYFRFTYALKLTSKNGNPQNPTKPSKRSEAYFVPVGP
ncbi:hypothetical protein PoB_003919400 [Plakobranchus ocellatus]|uniref:Uncharacterized protein n=1 Tax=Plakobranchus ocellatus TaxID=259542 RepID=A0AAV4B2V2_9GAST|nr:hypothetical protein PoB_003919400 [Plakobranchus ocellatus]